MAAIRVPGSVLLAASLASLPVLAAPSRAEPAPDDDEEAAPAAEDGEASADDASEGEDAGAAEATAAPRDMTKVEWGVGARLRWIFVPKGMLELFMESVPSGVGSPGIGLEVTRRRGEFEMSFGFEYESLSPDDGFYREKGGGDDPGNVSARTDYTEFDGFSWLTLDATFAFHRPITPQIALRYGAGLGLGFLMGEVLQTDSICSGPDIQEQCVRNPNGAQVDDPADLPPVFPAVALFAGGQYRASDKLTFNLELGLRTIFYTGLGATYYW